MLRSRKLSVILTVAALGALVVGGIAAAQSMMKPGSGDVIADRQRLMKLNGALARDIGDKAKAGSIEAIAVNAEALAINAQHIPMLFPQGSMSDKSKAKPEIWQKWPEFEAAAKKLQVKAEDLRDTARSKNAEATQEMLKTFGRETCAPCHDAFRVPPPRS
jgi:cytochrome c556